MESEGGEKTATSLGALPAARAMWNSLNQVKSKDDETDYPKTDATPPKDSTKIPTSATPKEIMEFLSDPKGLGACKWGTLIFSELTEDEAKTIIPEALEYFRRKEAKEIKQSLTESGPEWPGISSLPPRIKWLANNYCTKLMLLTLSIFALYCDGPRDLIIFNIGMGNYKAARLLERERPMHLIMSEMLLGTARVQELINPIESVLRMFAASLMSTLPAEEQKKILEPLMLEFEKCMKWNPAYTSKGIASKIQRKIDGEFANDVTVACTQEHTIEFQLESMSVMDRINTSDIKTSHGYISGKKFCLWFGDLVDKTQHVTFDDAGIPTFSPWDGVSYRIKFRRGDKEKKEAPSVNEDDFA